MWERWFQFLSMRADTAKMNLKIWCCGKIATGRVDAMWWSVNSEIKAASEMHNGKMQSPCRLETDEKWESMMALNFPPINFGQLPCHYTWNFNIKETGFWMTNFHERFIISQPCFLFARFEWFPVTVVWLKCLQMRKSRHSSCQCFHPLGLWRHHWVAGARGTRDIALNCSLHIA